MQINYTGRDVIDVKRSRRTLVAGIVGDSGDENGTFMSRA